MACKKNIVLLFALCVSLFFIKEASAQTDSLYMFIDSTTVVSERNTSTIRQTRDRMLEINLTQMQSMPKLLGNTDPLHFVRLLPGVQTNAENDSGIHIQGSDSQHNEMSVAGVPLFGVNHMFGLFTIFNPEHYSKMNFSHSSSSNRLGGTLRMELPDTLTKRIEGSVSVGIMSSQGALGFRLGDKSHLRLAARKSYLNALYGRWLKLGDSPIRYGLGDYNLTYLWDSGSGDKVWLDGYFGMDSAGMSESSYNLGVSLKWGNYMGALHWNHKGGVLAHNHSLYSSGYMSKTFVRQTDASIYMPSFINAAGYKGELLWQDLRGSWDAVYYHVMPQHPMVSELFNSSNPDREIQNALEVSLSVGYDYSFASDWSLNTGLKGTLFQSDDMDLTWGLNPDISLSYNAYNWGKVSLNYNWKQQYIFQAGLSNIGFPIEFWFVAGKYSRPQNSQNISLSYDLNFHRDMFRISCDIYYKRLSNQVEYKGDLLDLFLANYDLNDYLLKGNGWNYGVDFMLHKQSGKLTGWVSYSWGRALRKFNNPEYPDIYPSNHERIHELNLVGSYKHRSWDFSGTFVYASGLPFTAPGSYFISSGKIIANYGEHNACRLLPYIKLDLSVNYEISKNDKRENGVNLSIYNVLMRRNEVMYRLCVNEDNQYGYKSLSFGLRFLPSISYYHKF